MSPRPLAYSLRSLLLSALAGLALLGAGGASAQTYTTGSTTYSLIDSSSHTKIGYNTSPYKFNAGSGCGTAPPVLDDTLSDAVPIGFSFAFGTAIYTKAYIVSNGRLQFGNTTCGAGTANIGPPQTYPYGYPNTSMNGSMKVFGVDLDPTNLVDKPNYPSAAKKTPCLNSNSCYVSVATTGTVPTRQFIVTWKNVPEWVSASNTSGAFDLQIILNEDGSFIYQYGTISHGGTGTAQIGWQLGSTDYQVLAFGAAVEPSPNTAIKFFIPRPQAAYSFDEGSWVPGKANQVLDSTGNGRHGTVLGDAQTSTNGKVCRAADIPLNTSGGAVDAVRTGVNLADTNLNLLGTGSVAFWYRANQAWSGSAAQLLDATAVNGQWFYLSKTAAGALVFKVTDSTGVSRSVTTPAQGFAASSWVHLTVTWNFNGHAGSNQDALQVFVNAGTPTVAAFTSNGTVTTQAGYLHAGDNPLGIADAQGTVNSANGQLDELAVYNYVLSAAQITSVMNASHACASLQLDHLEIQHPDGSGLTCAPSTITVRACQDASCSIAYTGGVSGTLSNTGSPNVNWDGSSGNGSGARFAIAAGSGTVTKRFQATTVGKVVLGSSGLSPAASTASSCNFGAPACTFIVGESGLVFDVPDHPAEQTQSLKLSAVSACAPVFASTTRLINFSCSYMNPNAGSLPVRVGAQALNAGRSSTAACDAGGASLSLSFDASGSASTTLQYADVGQVNLAARYVPSSSGEAGLVMTGSDSFVSKPQDLVLSLIRCSSVGAGGCAQAAPGNNPAATTAAGAAFIAAGKPFSATVTALNAAGAATPNFGRESTPEGVKLGANLLLPTPGLAPLLSNASAFGSFSGGSASGSSFAWSEVGIITLTPSLADGDYLGAGDVIGSVATPVGRFVPAGLVVSASSLVNRANAACASASGFTYLDESFQLGFTLTAVNAQGGTTRNYTGSFAKLDLNQPGGFNLAGIQGSTTFKTGNARLGLVGSAGAWNTGVAADVSLLAIGLRAAAPDGPFDTASFGIAPQDSDGVGLSSFNLDTDSPANGADRGLLATVPLRFGRLRLQNAIGSQARPLRVGLQGQYWNGTAFVTNTLDSCSRISAANLAFGNFRKTLTSSDASLVSSPVTLASGAAFLSLAAPAAGRSGSYELALSLGASATDASCLQSWTPGKPATAGAGMAYLRGAWCSASYGKDPSARATFGLYRGTDATVYQRENY